MSSDVARPSVYTPFLRRFTDERARDLSDTIALYRSVHARHGATVWSHPNAIDAAARWVVETVTESISLPRFPPLREAIDCALRDILALETTIFSFPEIDWDSAALSLKEQVDLRRFLRSKEHFLANDDRLGVELANTLFEIVTLLLDALPEIDVSSGDGAGLSVPLVALLAEPGKVIDRMRWAIAAAAPDDGGLFVTLWHRLYENLCTASGVAPATERRKPLTDADESSLPPVELAETYFGGTPLCDLLLSPLPFAIPDDIRFEHTHIVAGTGHGKTQTLQHLIMGDLSRPPEIAPSLVIIDSQGDMLTKIAGLDLFDPDNGALGSVPN